MNITKKYLKSFFILYVLLFASYCLSCTVNKKSTSLSVIAGVYDIGNLDISEVIPLEGEWTFIPNELVPPTEDFDKYVRFENLNTSWTKYIHPMNKYGYATYAVKIKNILPEKIYAIRTGNVSSAFIAYLNGEEFFRYGEVGTSKEQETFDWNSVFTILPTDGLTEATLVFHVSNFHDRNSGFSKPIRIGFYSTMLDEKNKDSLIFTILAGFLLGIATFFISLYVFYKKELPSLLFGLLCLNFCLRIYCYDEFILRILIPQLSPMSVFKIGYATLSLAIILASLLIRELFSKIKIVVKRKTIYIMLLPAFIYLIINLAAPMQFSTDLLLYFQIYLLLFSLYDFLISILAAFKRENLVYFFLFGLLVFLLLTIHDILISHRVMAGKFISYYGLPFLFIPMTVIVLNHFKTTSIEVSNMTKKIALTNEALKKFIPTEFMSFLNKTHTEISLGNNILKDMYIAFIHIGFSSLATTKEDRLNILNVYNKLLSHINPIIQKNKGFIDKYFEGGLMVLFYGSADEAISCMLEIRRIINDENTARTRLKKENIVFACGVHYGKLMIGTIGEHQRMDSTVISDAVNIASRLHVYALKKGVNIFISSDVKTNIKINNPRIKFTNGELVRFRGKEKPTTIYEVIKV